MLDYSIYLLKKLVKVFLILIFSIVFVLSAETERDWSNSLKPCWAKKSETNYNHLLASDNVEKISQLNSVTVLVSDNLIKGINSVDGNTIWETQFAGTSISEPQTSGNNVFILTRPRISYEADKTNIIVKSESESIYLTSINITSGLTNWKIKVPSAIKIFVSSKKDKVYILSSKTKFSSVNILDGKLLWTKDFQEEIISVSPLEKIVIISTENNQITAISSDNGDILTTKKISDLVINYSQDNNEEKKEVDNNILSTDESGNIIYFNLAMNKKNWQRKVGGKISNINFYENTLFISSFDNFVYLFNKATGKLLLKRRLDGRIVNKTSQQNNIIAVSAYNSLQITFFNLKINKAVNLITLSDADIFIDQFVFNGKFLIITTPKIITAFSFDC